MNLSKLAWEVFTDGEVPYPGIHDDNAVKRHVRSGNRLAQPSFCPPEIYQVRLLSASTWLRCDKLWKDRKLIGIHDLLTKCHIIM